MDINNLTEQEAIELLNTDFGADMEKQAAAIVEAEEYIEYGQELALEKIAQMEANYEDGQEYDQEKVASADEASEYIQQGFVEAMMKLGEANYGDELIYLEEMAKEANKVTDAFGAAKKWVGSKGTAVKDYAASKGSALKTRATNDMLEARMHGKQMFTGNEGSKHLKIKRLQAAKNLLKTRTGQIGAAGLVGGATYGGKKTYDHYKK